MQLPRLQMAVALLSPFLVSWLQLLSSVPQEDVVLFLGVVVLVALRKSDTGRKNEKETCSKSRGKRQIRSNPAHLRPFVAGGVRKDVAVVIEATRRDWLVQLL